MFLPQAVVLSLQPDIKFPVPQFTMCFPRVIMVASGVNVIREWQRFVKII